VPLAKRLDFYAAEGVEVELLAYPSGKQALDAMFAGRCALAAAAETPVVHFSLERKDFRIIAAIATNTDFERIVASVERGVVAIADLRGRRIAVPEFTTAHYFLDAYLRVNGFAANEVTKVYLTADKLAAAFRRGEVDAAVHWEPNIQLLAAEFGTKAKVFSLPGLHVSPFLLVAKRDYLRQQPGTVERVLRAVIRAEVFARAQPKRAMGLVAEINAVGLTEVKELWALTDFRVSLDQSLPFILENAARWSIGLRAVAQQPAMPNYLEFVDADALHAVKPAAVTIIR
jgi:NitT/TauT family transport system substrate-binding protein